MSGLIVRYTMYIQGEYNNDWEWVGDEESVLEIFRFFGFFAIFEPPQNAWDKNFRNECRSEKRCLPSESQFPTGPPSSLSIAPSLFPSRYSNYQF